MKRIVLAVALLLGGTAVAHANPPGLTPGPEAQDPYRELGPRAERGERGPGLRQQHRGPRAQRHRLPPRLRAMLVQRFDRDGDGRLQGPERRAAKRFVRHVIARRMHAQQQRRGMR